MILMEQFHRLLNEILYTYTPKKLEFVIKDVKQGMAVLTASKKWGVPRTTLRDKVRTGTSTLFRVGPDPVLGYEIERDLEHWLLKLIRIGAPIPVRGLCWSVKRLCRMKKIKTPFKQNCPGRTWVGGFFKRHPIFSIKRSEYLSRQRALLTEAVVRKWFIDVRQQLVDDGIDLSVLNDPRRVFNLDETALFTNPQGQLVIAEKGKTANSIGANTKENATILFTANANGDVVTKTILYPYERMQEYVTEATPDDWSIGKTKSGWMTAEAFFEYMANCFYPYLKENKIQLPVIVFLDGHSSHLSLPLSDFCAKHKIVIVCLPPNATHFIQPLDVGFYKPFKSKWKSFAALYRLQHEGQNIKKHLLPAFVNELGLEYFAMDLLNAFRCCGIFPFDENNLDYTKLVTHKIADEEEGCPLVESENPDQTNEPNSVAENEKSGETNETNNVKNLSILESKIEPTILNEFRLSRSQKINWLGDVKYTALYEIWMALKDEEGEDELFPNEDTAEYEFVVNSPGENGLCSLSCIGSVNEVRSFSPVPVLEEIAGNGLNESPLSSSVDSVPPSRLATCTPIEKVLGNLDDEELIESFLTSEVTEEVDLPPTSENPATMSPLNNDVDEALDESFSGSPVSKILDSITFYPNKISGNKKRKINRKQLPSLISSKKWRALFTAENEKEEEKKRIQIEKKKVQAEKKKIQEENKKIQTEKKRKKKEALSSNEVRKKKVAKCDSSDDEFQISEELVDNPEPVADVIEAAPTSTEFTRKQVTEGQFVIVKYVIPPKKSSKKNLTREYVGLVQKIVSTDAEHYEVKFLRPYKGKQDVFSFPTIDDIDIVPQSSIVKILPTPVEARKGIYDFVNRVLT